MDFVVGLGQFAQQVIEAGFGGVQVFVEVFAGAWVGGRHELFLVVRNPAAEPCLVGLDAEDFAFHVVNRALGGVGGGALPGQRISGLGEFGLFWGFRGLAAGFVQALRGGEFEEEYLLLRIKFHVSPLGFSRWGGPKWSTDRCE